MQLNPLPSGGGKSPSSATPKESDRPTGSTTPSSKSSSTESDSTTAAKPISGSGSFTSYISSELAYPEPTKQLHPRSYIAPRIHKTVPMIPFEDDIEVFKIDRAGGTYSSKAHKMELIIPEGAVSGYPMVTLEFGVTLHGPFTFPKDTKPVSAIVWFSLQGQSSFHKSIEIVLPHFINYAEDDSQSLAFFVTNGEKYQFQKQRDSGRGISSTHGTLRTRLSKEPCFICIATKNAKDIATKSNYCIVKAMPKLSPTDYIWRVHFCVSYLLPTCIEVRCWHALVLYCILFPFSWAI